MPVIAKMTDYLRDYYSALSSVDESIGRLRSSLEAAGLDDDTVIVSTAIMDFS